MLCCWPTSWTKLFYHLCFYQQQTINLSRCSYYRAKPSGARYCQGKLSVLSSVHLSVCNVEVGLVVIGPVGWNSWKIISRPISLTFFTLCRPQLDGSSRSTPKGTLPNFSRNMSGIWKIVCFRH